MFQPVSGQDDSVFNLHKGYTGFSIFEKWLWFWPLMLQKSPKNSSIVSGDSDLVNERGKRKRILTSCSMSMWMLMSCSAANLRPRRMPVNTLLQCCKIEKRERGGEIQKKEKDDERKRKRERKYNETVLSQKQRVVRHIKFSKMICNSLKNMILEPKNYF